MLGVWIRIHMYCVAILNLCAWVVFFLAVIILSFLFGGSFLFLFLSVYPWMESRRPNRKEWVNLNNYITTTIHRFNESNLYQAEPPPPSPPHKDLPIGSLSLITRKWSLKIHTRDSLDKYKHVMAPILLLRKHVMLVNKLVNLASYDVTLGAVLHGNTNSRIHT